MKTYKVLHVNKADFNSDRFLNEYGSKRPAQSVVVGIIEAERFGEANKKARETYPAPEGWFTTIHEVRQS
jgi:hypothetical protein